ncbi:catalase family protein [Vreelandella sp. TE19]
MELSTPLRYTPDVETPLEDEQDVIDSLNDTFDTILEHTSEDYGHAVRAVHAKAHGILSGTLSVEQGLSDELAQGLFAKPGEFDVFLRLSTNAGDILPDAVSLPRGLALKVVDVEGERLPDSEGHNQDFILLNAPVFQAPTASKFLTNLKMLASTTDRLEGTKVVASKTLQGVNKALEAVSSSSTTLNALGGAPNIDPLGETYYSATAFRYGDYMAKFMLRPVSDSLKALTGRTVDIDGRQDAIREDVRGEMHHRAGEWEFCVQLCRDLEKQPIEDATVEWEETRTPFQRVATLRVPAQDSWQEEKVKRVEDEMRFSVWTGIIDHQPLGNINRVRKETYRHSADFRARFNGCPYHEPSAGSH